MLTPVALVAIVAAALTNYILVVALPDANHRFREITYEVIATRAQDEVRPRVFYEDFPNIILYVQDVAPDGSWSQVFLADTRHGGQPDVYLARKGRMQLDRDNRLVDMVLEDGTGHHINGQGPDQYELRRFEEIRISLDPESVFPRRGPQRGYRRADDFQSFRLKSRPAPGRRSPVPPADHRDSPEILHPGGLPRLWFDWPGVGRYEPKGRQACQFRPRGRRHFRLLRDHVPGRGDGQSGLALAPPRDVGAEYWPGDGWRGVALLALAIRRATDHDPASPPSRRAELRGLQPSPPFRRV